MSDTAQDQNGRTWLHARIAIDSPSLMDRFGAYRGEASPSQEKHSEREAFECAMRTAFEGAVSDFAGTGRQMTAYDIRTFTLITDDDLANPSHAGGDMGV
ncbi:MAG TPA: hypothetical protein ENN85_04210, partial [Methanoculleus sp.]|nr:hypothetical protein [Methanoculleus sp.]